MRYINNHLVEGERSPLLIEVRDAAGPGGANHRYDVVGFDTTGNPSAVDENGYATHFSRLPVIFQHGVVVDGKMNGVTMESLLAICEDRLQGFQSGQFACVENERALVGVQKAIAALQERTKRRIAQGTEGTEKAA